MQSFQYPSATQGSEYARICLDRVLNVSCVLNIPGFWKWLGSEYVGVTQACKYATIGLNMSK